MDLLLSMRTVATVADLGSFTRAAERLGLSRPMASKHVADLETHLGVRLFNRTTRKLSLTDDGAALLETFRQVLELVDATRQRAQDSAGQPSGLLRVSAPMSFGIAYLSPLIVSYLEAHTKARIDLALNDRFVDLVEEGYDLAIRIGDLSDSSLIATRISVARLHLVASPAYLRSNGSPADLKDIPRHRCLDYAQGAIRNGWSFHASGRTTVTPPMNGFIRCNNGDALVRMAVEGGGIAYQPDFIVADCVRTGALELVLPEIATRTIGIYAVYPPGRHVPLKTRAFIDYLRSAYAGMPPWSLQPSAMSSPLPAKATGSKSRQPTLRSSRAPRKASQSP